MCAIAGLLDVRRESAVLQNMLQTMKRRGPDGNGIYQAEECTLLHSRLAVIDPQGGQQPMMLDWAGERYVLVYNGELYNTEEIRRELVHLGHRFQGYSDTEVVLHSYAQWRSDCVHHFNGIFAFGVWEEKNRRLFLARDRIGVKPLFYCHKDTGLVFASEIKTILASGCIRPQLDREGAAQLILLGPGRKPGSGIFHGIMELEPGCRGWYQDGKMTIDRYWMLRDREHEDTLERTVETVRDLVLDAIRRQMVSDVPIGTFLSGGLDSSVISAVCAEEMAKSGNRLQTFSVDYQNNDRYFRPGKFQPNSDSAYIQIMQTFLQSDHSRTELDAQTLAETLEDATQARDLPGMADVDFSLLAFCREIRRNVTVALSGECADEIFGGYPWYRDPEVREAEGFPWAQNTLERASFLPAGIVTNPRDYVMDCYRQTCRESDILPQNTPLEMRMKEMVNLNFRWFMQTLLDRKDRMSMFSSLEVRVPFCDYRIAEYLYGVPWQYKDLEGREKGLLRRAMEGVVPREILYRKKSPYPKTFDPAYETIMRQRLTELLESSDAPLFHIVDRAAIKNCLNADSDWPWYGQLMRRPQIMAYFLQMNHWLDRYRVEFLF